MALFTFCFRFFFCFFKGFGLASLPSCIFFTFFSNILRLTVEDRGSSGLNCLKLRD